MNRHALLCALAVHLGRTGLVLRAHQYSTDVRDAMNDAKETAIGTSPVLELWNGSKPANCATADTGTKIASGTLPSDWMSASSSGTKSKTGTWTVTGLSAAGSGTNAQYFRITVSGVCKWQGSVTATGGGGEATMDNVNVANGQTVTVSTFQVTAGNA